MFHIRALRGEIAVRFKKADYHEEHEGREEKIFTSYSSIILEEKGGGIERLVVERAGREAAAPLPAILLPD